MTSDILESVKLLGGKGAANVMCFVLGIMLVGPGVTMKNCLEKEFPPKEESGLPCHSFKFHFLSSSSPGC